MLQNDMRLKQKVWVHVGLASLSTIAFGLQDYKNFDEIPNIKIAILALNAIIQSLNAYKALMDTSSGRNAIKNEQDETIELQNYTSNISISS